MVKTRSSTKVPGGAPPHRLEVRLRSRETDRKGTTRSVQVQAALPMDTTDSETVTSGEKRERVVVGGETDTHSYVSGLINGIIMP